MNDLTGALIIYALSAALVVYGAIKAGNYVDMLDKKTNISGALIGGLLLAAVTSLPEFITTISSVVILEKPELAFGNVFGSNMFNIVILAIADLVYIKKFMFQKASGHNKSLMINIVMYLVVTVPVFIQYFLFTIPGVADTFNVSIISIVIVIIYGMFLKTLMAAEAEETDADDEMPELSVKQIVVRFCLVSVLLVLSSIIITRQTDTIAEELNLSASFAGALFLGIATSLPELTAVFTLIKLNNYNAAISNIIGSNIFNMTIISVVDVLTVPILGVNIFNTVFEPVMFESISVLLVIGLINSFIILLAFSMKKTYNKMVYAIPSVLIILNYLIYISISV